MTRLILMRHGNTFEEGQNPIQIGARTDLPLTASGQKQAQAMAQYLKRKEIVPKAIFAGQLKRQTESAYLIGKEFEINFENTRALNEVDYGLWEGLTAEQIQSKWPKEYAEWNDAAEWQVDIFQSTAEKYLEPFKTWVEELRKKYPNQTILAVTSNGILRFIRNEKVKTGHFCEIELESGCTKVISWNRNPASSP